MIDAWRENLLPAVARFRPDLVLISAGFDSREEDLLGCFDVTDLGFIKLTRMVMDIAAEHCEGRLVSVLEGGYNVKGLSSAVEMHVQTLLEYAP
jgi:acetoin utilization deacetylase AcuC-like enzyme